MNYPELNDRIFVFGAAQIREGGDLHGSCDICGARMINPKELRLVIPMGDEECWMHINCAKEFAERLLEAIDVHRLKLLIR